MGIAAAADAGVGAAWAAQLLVAAIAASHAHLRI
jgi:hypothetical protein